MTSVTLVRAIFAFTPFPAPVYATVPVKSRPKPNGRSGARRPFVTNGAFFHALTTNRMEVDDTQRNRPNETIHMKLDWVEDR